MALEQKEKNSTKSSIGIELYACKYYKKTYLYALLRD